MWLTCQTVSTSETMAIFQRNSIASSSSARSVEEPTQSRSSRLFGHHPSTSSKTSVSTTSSHRHSLLRRPHEDPSIQAAREQVGRAEAAEREADKALMAARRAVKEAREHVKRLEKEAAEEYVTPVIKPRRYGWVEY